MHRGRVFGWGGEGASLLELPVGSAIECGAPARHHDRVATLVAPRVLRHHRLRVRAPEIVEIARHVDRDGDRPTATPGGVRDSTCGWTSQLLGARLAQPCGRRPSDGRRGGASARTSAVFYPQYSSLHSLYIHQRSTVTSRGHAYLLRISSIIDDSVAGLLDPQPPPRRPLLEVA